MVAGLVISKYCCHRLKFAADETTQEYYKPRYRCICLFTLYTQEAYQAQLPIRGTNLSSHLCHISRYEEILWKLQTRV